MKKRRSDKELTIALCLSLTLHALLVGLLVQQKVKLLLLQLSPPPALADARKLPKIEQFEDEKETPQPPAILIDPKPKINPDFDPPKPPPPPPPPKKPKDTNEENIDWGEKDKNGIAISSAPGKQPLSARKAMEDQAFASRDPEGPEEFPDDPSQSLVPPGENGDGKMPMRDALAGKGTEGNPEELTKGRPDSPMVPPAPIPDRTAVASANIPRPETSGPSSSQQAGVEKSSPAETQKSAAERDGLANDPAHGDAPQILPIKAPNVIGVKSNDVAYPQIVEALTRPPGVKGNSELRDPIESPILPSLVAPDVTTTPLVQPATAALEIKPRAVEEMARRLGETDPLNAPAITEAMMHPPGDITVTGGAAALPELAQADQTGGPEIRDAIPAPLDEPRPEEMAQMSDQGAEAVAQSVVAKPSAAGAMASATGGVPGPPMSAADPAPDTGLESDPFAKIPGVDFHDGKVDARSGREVKPIRPHLSDTAKRDLISRQFPTLVFKVRIDKTGKVTDVTVIQGSGSQAVDMPVYRALWEWWFEPPKDKSGNPLEDVQLVSIHWG